MTDADVIVVGAGLAGLVATAELADAGRRVILLDQEPETSLGGQAFWSFGGLFFVDSPEQRRFRIRDSPELALQDWLGSAGFDRPEDAWPRRWAEAYVEFAAGEKRQWLHDQGVRFLPTPGWAERGGYLATEHGNSVPRFHITWGTGPGLIEPFARRVREGAERGLVGFALPPPGRSAVDDRWCARRRDRNGARAELGRARAAELANPGRRIRSERAGGDRDLGRDRRQPRPRPRFLAGLARNTADADAVRGTRPRRRPDAQDHRRRRRPHHQPRPDVALHRGDRELEPDLEPPRDPDPARSLAAVARRARETPAGAAVPGLRHARDARAPDEDGPRLQLVRADPEDDRARVRAVRVRAEPGPDLAQRAPGAGGPGRQGRAGAGRAVQALRRRLHRRARSSRPRPAHERTDWG